VKIRGLEGTDPVVRVMVPGPEPGVPPPLMVVDRALEIDLERVVSEGGLAAAAVPIRAV
jgi:hypothetical protein